MTVDRLSCPPRDVLIEAAAPSADPAQRERVADHLITCVMCAEEFRLLQALGPWASQHAHLLAPGHDTAGGVRLPAIARRRWLPPGYAIAAVLAVVAVALTVQNRRLDRANRALAARTAVAPAADGPRALDARVAEQQRAIDDLEQRVRAADAPDLNPPIIDLEASGGSRAAAIPAAPALRGDARRVVFILNTARRRAGASYEVDIVDAADRVAWTGSGLMQSADGTLTLAVPRSLAAAGSRIRLYSRAGDRRTLVEQYVVPASR